MPTRLVVTGASGYIGSRLVERAIQRGCDVTVLGSKPPGFTGKAVPWRLGDEVPTSALAGATAIIHLGHSWASDAVQGSGAENVNFRGAIALARSAGLAGVPHFVFASTTSARENALNAYGRIKFAIEGGLRRLPSGAQHVVNARIGLVYGEPERGLFATMTRLSELAGVLPMIGLDRDVQPIHLDEVCDGLLRLTSDPPAGRDTFVLAASAPVTFGTWLRMLRRARTGKRMRLVPIPMWCALLACDATRFVPFIPTVSRERVLGLASAGFMESAADLAALAISPRDPLRALAQSPAARRRRIADAATMLAYVSGRRVRSIGALSRLTRALERDPSFPASLPPFAQQWPALLRLFEPIRPSMAHSLSRRLHLAAMVAETLPNQMTQPGLATIAAQIALEVLAFPFRLVLGSVCA